MIEGSYGLVEITGNYVTKHYKDECCATAFREIVYTHIVPFAIKPLSVRIYGEKISIIFPYAGIEICKCNLTFEEKNRAMLELLTKVNWLHQNGICHNDLMHSNILYNNGVNIIDWGLSCMVFSRQTYRIYTKKYLAPGIRNRPITTRADLWALSHLIKVVFGNKIDAYWTNISKYLRTKGSSLSTLVGPVIQIMWPNAYLLPRIHCADPRKVTKQMISYCYEQATSGLSMNNSLAMFATFSYFFYIHEENCERVCAACIQISDKIFGKAYRSTDWNMEVLIVNVFYPTLVFVKPDYMSCDDVLSTWTNLVS